MDFRDWLSDSISHIRADGVGGVSEALYPVYKKGLHQLFRITRGGQPIYQSDWDLLIVLDGCRLDLMKEVAGEFPYIDHVGRKRSVDTMTREWMKKNFTDEFTDEMSNTAFLSGNPHSDWLLDAEDFLLLDEVWKYGWDDELGTLPPRPLTDRAISVARTESPPRMIVHYMQPHYPFIPTPGLDKGIDIDRFGELPWANVWDRLRKGDITEATVWEGYCENLKHVLDDVELLLENVDAETVVITADHGNAVGEWGIYGHPIHMPVDAVQLVPWVETSATDNHTHEPADYKARNIRDDVEARLKQLGYK